ncbi:hypothetical protein D0865_16554 [Hortaea werneckii]|uniref:Uncharacterized protein n=1 Tax=Hortaea werneckii TaxID=91943 RepID=A0A3M7A4K1_HORWE|nr:hypothetical protein D0865_16554 [Hortaea werneckii]
MADDITPTSSHGTTSSERSSLKPRPLNFSRPRPTRVDSKQKIYHDHSGGGGSGSGGGGGRVRGISAFHEPSGASASNGRDHLPREPRFSIDSDLTTSTSSNSAASEFAWDDTSGELRSRRPDEVHNVPRGYERSQRYSKDSTASSNPAQSTTSSSTAGGGGGGGGSGGSSSSNTAVAPPGSSLSGASSSSTSRPFIAELPGSEPQQPPSMSSHRPPALQKHQQQQQQQQHLQPRPFNPPSSPQIMKRTSVDQQSERMSTSTTRGDWEDTASHHTVSIYDGETGGHHHNPYQPPSSLDGRGGNSSTRKDSTTTANSNGSNSSQWTSSDFTTTGLSDAEIRKLKKKGINPSLYAEMKAARKGKGKWVGPLVGNTFIG